MRRPGEFTATRALWSRRQPAVTAREGDILGLIARGFGDKEIASALGVAPRTVRTHLERLFRRHDFHSRAAAVSWWLAGGSVTSRSRLREPGRQRRPSDINTVSVEMPTRVSH